MSNILPIRPPDEGAKGTTNDQGNQPEHRSPPPVTETENPEQYMNLLIAVDIEHERIIMYRVLIVLEMIVLLILIREILLAIWL